VTFDPALIHPGAEAEPYRVLVAGVIVETFEEGGVRQTKTTVTYRFSQPNQPMPLVLPQSYSTGSVVRIPTELRTIGDHIRRRRLELKMLQREVAVQLGVDTTCVFNWEAQISKPEIRYMPAIIAFLGYNPLPEVTTIGERLVRQRTTLGLTQKDAAERVGVDPSTLAKWERGERQLAGTFLVSVERFLDGEQSQLPRHARRAG
jgi:transcriptional regulator with XRE-family HTH domain